MRREVAVLVGALSVVGASAQAQTDGATVFAQNCAACHQATGKGIPGAFPALAGDAFVKGPPALVVSTVLNGRGGMPRFGDQLDDATLAAAVSYVRGAWGNGASAVTAGQVAALRSGPAPAAASGAVQAH